MSGVVSVGAAVGAAAIAADGAATVGMTLTTMMSVTAAVGATASAVGYFTKNKALQIGGGALAVVGGIGGIAAGAGMFGSVGGAAGSAVTDAGAWGAATDAASWGAEGAASAAGAAGGAGAPYANVGDLISGQGLGGDVISGITGMPAPADTLVSSGTSAASPLTTPTPSVASASPTDQFGHAIAQGDLPEGGTLGVSNNPAATGGLINTPAPAAPPTAPGPAPTTPAAATAPTPLETATTPGPYDAKLAPDGMTTTSLKIGATQPTSPLPEADSSSWSSILKFMKDNPALTMGGITAASSFLSGAFNPKTPAEVGALNASAAKSAAETGLINRQHANIEQPLPAATRTRTNTGTGRIDRAPMVAA